VFQKQAPKKHRLIKIGKMAYYLKKRIGSSHNSLAEKTITVVKATA
jgi:hypothetical protein